MVYPDWFRQRRYLHFDEPLGFLKAHALVIDPLAVSRHSFWPLLRFKVETIKIKQDKATGSLISNQKDRDISYAAHGDSQILSYYCQLLSALYEEEIAARGLDRAVLAFRSLRKSNIDFAKDAFDEIRLQGDCSVVALDVTKFFDTIDHSQLKQRWKSLLHVSELPPDHFAVFRTLTRHAVVDRNAVFKEFGISLHNPRAGRQRICTAEEFRNRVRGNNLVLTNPNRFGIPQGTAVSAMLSNLYMIDFDSAAHAFAENHGGRYMRYCDDMLFVMPPGLTAQVEAFADSEIKSLGLAINPKKTDRCNFKVLAGGQMSDKPLQYLGFLFDGQKIIIRSAAFAKFSNRMKRGVGLAKKTMRSCNRVRGRLGAVEQNLYLKKLYSRYSHLGKRNFLRYGYRAAETMNSSAIKRQLRPLWGRLQKTIAK